MTEANKRQVGGNHYAKNVGVQHWDLVALFNLDYYQGNVSKYLFRWRDKAGIQDLEKARHYLDKYIEIEKLRAKGMLTLGILKAALEEISEITMAGDRCGVCVYLSGNPPRCAYCGHPPLSTPASAPGAFAAPQHNPGGHAPAGG